MKTNIAITTAASALVCGAFIGYFMRPQQSPVVPEKEVTRHEKRVPQNNDDATTSRLYKRIRDLEKQLAGKNIPPPAQAEPIEETPAAPQKAPAAERRGPPSPEDMRTHMEEIRKNDPERYTQMTNHFATMRARQLSRAQNKLDILASVDVNRLSPKQRELHDNYQNLIARHEELRNIAFAPADDSSVTDEQRKAAHEELRTSAHELHKLAQTERQILLDQTARSFGIKGEAAKDMVETVKAVYEATESWGGRRHHKK